LLVVSAKRSDRLPQGGCRSLQTVTDLGELSRGEIDALLLDVCALLLTFSARAKRLELALQLLNGMGEIRQLAGDRGDVVSGSQSRESTRL
jgi:hypothetical protein